MAEPVILVLDCGATNIRTIAVTPDGDIIASASLKNETTPDPENREFRIWDMNALWDKVCRTTRKVAGELDGREISGITVTTFGVDGAPVDSKGEMLYPVISWQCPRTGPIMENIEKYIPAERLYQISGLQPYPLNTITKLIWLKENKPQVLERMHHFLFMPSLFIFRLTGARVTDTSMAGTSMLTDLRTRDFSGEILDALGLDRNLFPELLEPGTIAGTLLPEASVELGIPEDIPVVVTGHDTQFAIFGAGAALDEPVLSSGTWEILMVRTRNTQSLPNEISGGVSTELDPIPGVFNPSTQWIASGTLEWIKKNFYSQESGLPDIYQAINRETSSLSPGSLGVRINPDFSPGQANRGNGMISGLAMDTPRGAVYRAGLEALSCKTRIRLQQLQNACGFQAKNLVCVGGGSKNRLWNQIRADVLNIPVRVMTQSETTVLGAAMFAFSGTGYYRDPLEAREAFHLDTQPFYPKHPDDYRDLFEEYRQILT